MNHNISKYINDKLIELKWQDQKLSKISSISKPQISKLKNGGVMRLSAQTFYLIVKAFGDSVSNATKTIYPDQKFTLHKYSAKPRNKLGNLILDYELSKNSLEEVSAKTGITEIRLNELYYRKGAPDAYELLLIEKALDKNPGEIFEKLFKI